MTIEPGDRSSVTPDKTGQTSGDSKEQVKGDLGGRKVTHSTKPLPGTENRFPNSNSIKTKKKPLAGRATSQKTTAKPSKEEAIQASREALGRYAGKIPSEHLKEAEEALSKAAESLRSAYTGDGSQDNRAAMLFHKIQDKKADIYFEKGEIAKALSCRKEAAEVIQLPSSHPMHHMDDAIAEGRKKQVRECFGAHFSFMDSGTVKGGNIRADVLTTAGQQIHQLKFKVGHHVRANLAGSLPLLRTQPQLLNNSLPEGCSELNISDGKFTFNVTDPSGRISEQTPTKGEALVFEFKGFGKVMIGNNPENGTLYNQVYVEVPANLPPGEAAKRTQKMMAMVGCGPVMIQQQPEDEKRLQVAQLFRAYYPREALNMERENLFYEMPVDQLMASIIEKVPEMKANFQKYFVDQPELMKKEEIYPGKSVWAISDISDQMRANGGYGLMASYGGKNNPEHIIPKISRRLTEGMLSSEDRFQSGLLVVGSSSSVDMESGSGDRVFTRLITSETATNDVDQFTLPGNFYFLFDMSIANRGGSYAYEEDEYGCKNPTHPQFTRTYTYRDSLPVHTKNLTEDETGNELMIKNRINPGHIKGILCLEEGHQKALVDQLKKDGMTEERSGILYLKGRDVKVDDFIHVSSTFEEEMWS